VDRYLRYFKDEYTYDDDKIIFVGTLLREKALAWYNNREDQLKKHFQVDTWRAFISSMEERFIDTEEEKENLRKMKELQYKGDIRDYIVKMEDLNYHVCLSGIAWREALHSGLNEDIKDRISFSKITPNDDTQNTNYCSNKSAAHMRDACKKRTNTSPRSQTQRQKEQ
jgi:hypothetical protein